MIFVTGGTGVLGSHLLYRLTVDGHSVRAIYRDPSRIDAVRQLFAYYGSARAEELLGQIEWVKCDVLDVVTLEDAMYGCDYVYHCAAMISFRKRAFSAMMKVNRRGTANVVNIALQLGVNKLCFVSSTAAVAPDERHPQAPLVEGNKWTQNAHTTGYAITKYSSEKEVWRAMEEGLNAVIVNPSTILGPGDWNESSLTIFRTIANGFRFYTSGANAFVDARDVTDAMVRLMESEISGERFLCTGTNISFRELFGKIARELNVKGPSIPAGSLMSAIAWRISVFAGLFTGKSTLTRETANSAQSVTTYDSSKLLRALDFKFTDIDDTIRNAVAGRLKS